MEEKDETRSADVSAEEVGLTEEAEAVKALSDMPEGAISPSEEAVDWKSRCQAAEEALSDSLAYAGLCAENGAACDGTALDSPIYQRFCALRSMGLSVKEAFYAADSARVKAKDQQPSGKGHLVASHTRMQNDSTHLTGEELSVMRELLGEEYSLDELMKLYRRVAKS
ncbi:MAG: hypothetical protein IJW46_05365 [Clostridia bacterium]|nr:hypothetical protein [Clostridia bacterium]